MSLLLWRKLHHGSSAGAADAYAVGGNAPEFVADFAGVLNSGTEYYRSGGSDTTFSSVFTFSRPTTATYVNSSGVLTTASSGVARRGHHVWNGSSWENAGILIEPAAATNLVTYSNDFTNAAWSERSAGSVTVTNNAALGPDGTNSLARVEITDATNEEHTIKCDGTVPSLTNTTVSAVVRYIASEVRYIAIGIFAPFSAGNFVTCFFDLSTGQFVNTRIGGSSGTLVGTYVENIDADTYRIAMSGQITSSGTKSAYIAIASDASSIESVGSPVNFSGTPGHGFYCGYFQVEVGSVPTSYIPTAGSTVTRAAETLTVAGATFDAQSSGTISALANFAHPSIDTNAQLWQLNGTGSDIALGIYTANNIQLNMDGTIAGTAVTAGNRHVSARWNGPLGTLAVSLDGGTIATNTTAAFSIAAHDFRLGVASVGQYKSYAMIRHWPGIALSDSDMQSAST